MSKDLVVLALGGNALLRTGERGTFEEQVRNLQRVSGHIARLASRYKLVITHGNGPQVGNLYLQQEAFKEVPGMPLHACVAMTQSLIGYMVQQAVSSVDPSLKVAVLTTRVEVDAEDPAFKSPSKPIGPYYQESEVPRLLEKGWTLVNVPGKGWRRVVPSPRPKRIVELEVVKRLAGEVDIVVAVGGGGIPVVRSGKGYEGVDAVIDKDLASSLLAQELNAEKFVILTDVEGVYLDYGTPSQRLVEELCAREALELVNKGVFPRGSMGPKVEAAALYAAKTGKVAVIAHLDRMLEAVEGGSGTRVLPC
ncbi:carbamate kinase [Thermofilum pendens]|uniref:Carbamate kinase n=1 Tax=Thermofilum pendens (strain DSM 2475 / Hrk 5) TaxID=368408 RepID=A1RWK2_THEPD|nr:carbamate kinase [Thermofilum pendens]ABL77582.1 carbamate kinase [Thermofilum pendens Hrk 5]